MASGWIVRVGEQDFPVADISELQAWAAERRLQPSNYVYNPTLERWMYAKDLEELKSSFAPPPPPSAPPILTSPVPTAPIAAGTFYCLSCGALGYPKLHTKGSVFIELVLWLAFIVPGLIYSIWRLTTKENVCRQCGQASLIPADTPRAQQLLRRGPGAV